LKIESTATAESRRGILARRGLRAVALVRAPRNRPGRSRRECTEIYASTRNRNLLCTFFGRQGGPLPVKWHSFSALLRQGSSLDEAMNQPVSGSSVVTHHLGALIALGTLLAINLAWMSKFFFDWW
jgi:hypothetical protein